MHRARELLRQAVLPGLALVTALLLGAAVIVLTDYENLRRFPHDPAGALGSAVGVVVEGYRAMLAGAIGDPARILAAARSGAAMDIARALRPISETVVSATPFIFGGLGLAVAFRAGLFNLGGSGQFFMGTIGAVTTASIVGGHLPPVVTLVVALAGGTLFGAAYGFVPGILKARTGAHEVITTLMLSAIAPNIAFLIGGLAPARPASTLPRIPTLLDVPTIRMDYGFVAALATAALVTFVLFRTTRGFELRVSGHSRTVAWGAGIHPARTVTLAMSLSGGLAGLGGAFFVLGPAAGVPTGPAGDVGYVALALALIGGLRSSGVVVAALLYGALTNGAKAMVIETGIPLALLTVIVAVALAFVAAPGLIRTIWRIRGPGPAFVAGRRGSEPADST